MCGIACVIDVRGGLDEAILGRFTDAVAHRGPDDRGLALFAGDATLSPEPMEGRGMVGLGHRRLSILDLSPAGHQPMFSADGHLAIVFNGEIYNYLELRQELITAGHQFHTHCDTEVILAAYREWGADCVRRFNGMWAFVLLDRPRRRLFLSRDRIGVKPLYWTTLAGGGLAFASEIKQFRTLPGVSLAPNRRAALTYLVNGYENPPETFFDGVFAFPPGHRAFVNLDRPEVRPEPFWDAANFAPQKWDERELRERIRSVFRDAVRFRLRSDVPVGGCLSGGLDSSAIFMVMHELEPNQQFNAFSACFAERDIDERPFMAQVIEATGSRHHQVFPSPDEFTNDMAAFLRQHDEPVGSLSMYAQYRIMRCAREAGVPVLLDGQGGDELFSGYWTPYMLLMNRWRRSGDLLSIGRHLSGACLPWGNIEYVRQAIVHLLEYRRRDARQLPYIVSRDLLNQHVPVGDLTWHRDAQALSPEEYRRSEICRIHLPRLLKWEDRNSMAFAIESRVPFLDVNLVELMLSVPPEMNLRNGWTKYQFRRAMDGILPRGICWRRDKKGFETPQARWLKAGPLHDHFQAWANQADHPAAEWIDTPFREVSANLATGSFDINGMFRLYCLDRWLGNTAFKVEGQ
jgi:asparagine synthase (glutamine-hydrolysing)